MIEWKIMRKIAFKIVKDAVAELCVKANLVLREDVLLALKRAYLKEKNKRAKKMLEMIIENVSVAKKEKLAVCQDTGMPIVFVEIGKGVFVDGKGIEDAIQEGIKEGYKKGRFRESVIPDPLRLTNQKSYFTSALVHYEHNRSDKLKITVLSKGFGCENKSQLKMFKPTAEIKEIKEFIVEVVKAAGPDACPPYVVGVGIGGTADYACLLAKKALLKSVVCSASCVVRKNAIRNTQYAIQKLESDLLKEINKLNIGPMGMGGDTTCLGVNVELYPTHIAGLPVAVNISCHALRSAGISL